MIERKYLAHFLDSSFGSGAPAYARLGKDLEEFNEELNPDVETKHNILGETSVVHSGYEPQAEVDPFYYEYDDALSEKIALNSSVGIFWLPSSAIFAFRFCTFCSCAAYC